MRINKYLPFAFIYFFLNIAGLPFGLTYTALLAPFFYAWILLKRKTEILLPFISLLLPFILAHYIIVGVETREYLITFLNLLAIYVFAQAVYTWLKLDQQIEKTFKLLLVVNIILCLVAMVFYFLPYNRLFWIEQNLTSNVKDFRRLKMFTYEASYYALVFIPLFAYFYIQFILGQNRIKATWLLFMLFLPLILSFSFGVIGCILIAGLISFLIHFGKLYRKRRVVNGFITWGFVLFSITFILFVFFRNNVFFIRIENVLAGRDSSAMGRTSDAFEIAKRLLNESNNYWGIGLGQLNVVGEDLIRSYYLYYEQTPVAIPNAAAETLALFGWVGLITRIFIQLFFFVITRAWTNYYRLFLFLFMFIYQFTGSYITNPAEYVIWVFAFTPVFKQFEARSHPQPLSSPRGAYDPV